jgi:hypothetical protein
MAERIRETLKECIEKQSNERGLRAAPDSMAERIRETLKE